MSYAGRLTVPVILVMSLVTASPVAAAPEG